MNLKKILTTLILSVAFAVLTAAFTFGAEFEIQGMQLVARSYYAATAMRPGVQAREFPIDDSTDIFSLTVGEEYEVLEQLEGFALVTDGVQQGYVNVKYVTISESIGQTPDEEWLIRQNIVNTGLSFVGFPYRWGGTNPASGVDCSGFTRYCIGQATGIWLSHHSGSQVRELRNIAFEELKPGDLVFYASGSIDHVAVYIGEGQIVHAANERMGIVISDVFHRPPVACATVF